MEYFHEHEEIFPVSRSYKYAGVAAILCLVSAVGSVFGMIVWAFN